MAITQGASLSIIVRVYFASAPAQDVMVGVPADERAHLEVALDLKLHPCRFVAKMDSKDKWVAFELQNIVPEDLFRRVAPSHVKPMVRDVPYYCAAMSLQETSFSTKKHVGVSLSRHPVINPVSDLAIPNDIGLHFAIDASQIPYSTSRPDLDVTPVPNLSWTSLKDKSGSMTRGMASNFFCFKIPANTVLPHGVFVFYDGADKASDHFTLWYDPLVNPLGESSYSLCSNVPYFIPVGVQNAVLAVFTYHCFYFTAGGGLPEEWEPDPEEGDLASLRPCRPS